MEQRIEAALQGAPRQWRVARSERDLNCADANALPVRGDDALKQGALCVWSGMPSGNHNGANVPVFAKVAQVWHKIVIYAILVPLFVPVQQGEFTPSLLHHFPQPCCPLMRHRVDALGQEV